MSAVLRGTTSRGRPPLEIVVRLRNCTFIVSPFVTLASRCATSMWTRRTWLVEHRRSSPAGPAHASRGEVIAQLCGLRRFQVFRPLRRSARAYGVTSGRRTICFAVLRTRTAVDPGTPGNPCKLSQSERGTADEQHRSLGGGATHCGFKALPVPLPIPWIPVPVPRGPAGGAGAMACRSNVAAGGGRHAGVSSACVVRCGFPYWISSVLANQWPRYRRSLGKIDASNGRASPAHAPP